MTKYKEDRTWFVEYAGGFRIEGWFTSYTDIDRSRVRIIGVINNVGQTLVSIKLNQQPSFYIRSRVLSSLNGIQSRVWMLGTPGNLLWLMSDGKTIKNEKFSDKGLFSSPIFMECENWSKVGS